MIGLGNDIVHIGIGKIGTTANGISNLMTHSEQKSLVETYTSCIQQYLAVHLLENATFYAERLVATAPTNDSLYLLALCYYRQNQPQRTKFILQQYQSKCDDSPDLLYLLATACHDLEDYGTAEEALLRLVRRDFRKTDCADINQFILTTSVSSLKIRPKCSRALPPEDTWRLPNIRIPFNSPPYVQPS